MTTTKSIHLSRTDHGKLAGILTSMKRKGNLKAPHLRTLLDELAEAVIVPEGEVPQDIIGMGSTVEYRNPLSGNVERAQLVFPADADSNAGRISVLAPLGAALIGEKVNTEVCCQAPDSTWTLHILKVEH
ncbi:MAG: transcription elongation factor GreAB [Spirochaetaceae bacterium]|nr:MAG: transcription elongation factor GreAB [Spirochaetaceae bacterium]